MAKGKAWSDSEIKTLLEMRDKPIEEIAQKLPNRTFSAIAKQRSKLKIVRPCPQKNSLTIKPVDIKTIDEVLKKVGGAFDVLFNGKVSDATDIKRLTGLSLVAARYIELLQIRERWGEVEARLERLEKIVEKIQGQQPSTA